MRATFLVPTLLFFPILSWGSSDLGKYQETESVFSKLKEAVANLREYSVIHNQQERFKKGLGPEIRMKVKYSQGKYYLFIEKGPNEGAEVLFHPGWNEGRVKVHKATFPQFNLNLDPHGSRMLESQHHPIEHLSFIHIVQSISSGVQNCRDFAESSAKAVLEEEGSGSIRLELKAPWKERREEVLKDEDIWAFSKRVKGDPYSILYNNGLEYGDSLPEDLKVPLCYASRTVLNLQAKTYLPQKLEVYDQQGRLYEQYNWEELNPNPSFAPTEFDPGHPGYHF